MADRWTICKASLGARWANDRISSTAQVSYAEGRDARKVEYASAGPSGIWGWSAWEDVLGGTISAWNMRVVGSSASSAMALRMSSEETAGNSST